MNYKLVVPPMTIHFCEKYPMRKKPVMAVSFDGENCQYKVASFNDEKTMRWFVECLNICSLDEGTCTEEWLSWLKSPVEVEE